MSAIKQNEESPAEPTNSDTRKSSEEVNVAGVFHGTLHIGKAKWNGRYWSVAYEDDDSQEMSDDEKDEAAELYETYQKYDRIPGNIHMGRTKQIQKSRLSRQCLKCEEFIVMTHIVDHVKMCTGSATLNKDRNIAKRTFRGRDGKFMPKPKGSPKDARTIEEKIPAIVLYDRGAQYPHNEMELYKFSSTDDVISCVQDVCDLSQAFKNPEKADGKGMFRLVVSDKPFGEIACLPTGLYEEGNDDWEAIDLIGLKELMEECTGKMAVQEISEGTRLADEEKPRPTSGNASVQYDYPHFYAIGDINDIDEEGFLDFLEKMNATTILDGVYITSRQRKKRMKRGGDEEDQKREHVKRMISFSSTNLIVCCGAWFIPTHNDDDAGGHLLYLAGNGVASVHVTDQMKRTEMEEGDLISTAKGEYVSDLCRRGQAAYIPGLVKHAVCAKGGLQARVSVNNKILEKEGKE